MNVIQEKMIGSISETILNINLCAKNINKNVRDKLFRVLHLEKEGRVKMVDGIS